MNEFMGLIRGVYEAKQEGFLPGGELLTLFGGALWHVRGLRLWHSFSCLMRLLPAGGVCNHV